MSGAAYLPKPSWIRSSLRRCPDRCCEAFLVLRGVPGGAATILSRRGARFAPRHQRQVRRILFDAAAVQVGLDLQPRSAAEARAIDLQIFDDPLHVIARLGERNLLDPVDRIDSGIAWVAIAIDPLFDAAAAGIVGRKCDDVGAAVILD